MSHRKHSRQRGAALALLALASMLLAFNLTGARGYETILRANVATGNLQTSNGQRPAVNQDGRYTIFWSDSSIVVGGDTNATGDIFLFDRVSNNTKRVNVGTNGIQANNSTLNTADISDNGDSIVFASNANNLVPNDTNNQTDVFLHNPFNNTTFRVIPDSRNGPQGNAASFNPVISPDGRFVAFRSYATNFLNAGVDTNNQPDIILFDRIVNPTSQFDRINEGTVNGNPSQANAEDAFSTFALSNEALYAVFDSVASNMVSGDSNGRYDIFLRNRVSRTTSRVSVGPGGVQGNGNSVRPTISHDGRWVAFESDASNLIAGDSNGKADIFLWDRNNPTTLERISVNSNGVQANGHSRTPKINSTGRFVTFWSDATNLVDGDTNNQPDIFVHDRVTGITTRVNITRSEQEANNFSQQFADISSDGSYVAFESGASNFVPNDTNNSNDIFLALSGVNSPSELTATGAADKITLNWADNSGNEERFVVQRRLPGETWAAIGWLAANTATYDDTTMNTCTRYQYRVLALSKGIRSPSNIASGRTTDCPPEAFVLRQPVTGTTFINPASIEFKWQVSNGADSYSLNVAGGFAKTVAASACTATECAYTPIGAEIDALDNGSYTWSVTATNTNGSVPASNAPFSFTVNDLLPPRAFTLGLPGNDAFLRHVDRVAPRWQNNPDAATYSLRITQISNNAQPRAIGDALLLNGLTPQADADGLTCTNVCIYTLTSGQKAQLDNGYYSWTVLASSPGGTVTEASNGNKTFTLNQADVVLIYNGSFENDRDNDGIPNNWFIENRSGDGRLCGTSSPNWISYDGLCAFRFLARSGEASKLYANGVAANFKNLSVNETLKLSLYAKANGLTARPLVRVDVTLANNTVVTRTFRLPLGTYDYTLYGDNNIEITGRIQSVRVSIQPISTAGALFIDNVALVASPRAPAAITAPRDMPTVPDTVLPPPTSPDGLIPMPPPADAGQ